MLGFGYLLSCLSRLLLDKGEEILSENNMDKLIFIVGFIIFSIYLGCLVYVISTQNKIQETLEDEDPELNN